MPYLTWVMTTADRPSSDRVDTPSCFRDMPGPEEAVRALTPDAAAPITMLMPASSLSACTKLPPTSGRRQDKYSIISLDGVMG